MNDQPQTPEDDEISQGLFADFFQFLKEEKIWWMLPLILILLAMAVLAILGNASGALAPFIYPFA